MNGRTVEENLQYAVSLEIAGPMAMWTDPASGSAPTSYPAPTWSAVKGIFESVLFLKSSQVIPIRVEIMEPVQYQNFVQNYGGPLRKSNQIKGKDSFQIRMNALRNVCYRLYAIPVGVPENYPSEGGTTTNGAHQYKSRFERRLCRGQCFSTPCLGLKDFPASYWGPVRNPLKRPADINMVIPSMLVTPFRDIAGQGGFDPVFDQNVEIFHGTLDYRFDGTVIRKFQYLEGQEAC